MKNNLQHLVQLLDDNDPDVFRAVEKELQQQGLAIIPHLEKIWELSPNPRVQERMENLIHSVQFANAQNKLQKWISKGADSLIEGASFIAQLQYPAVTAKSMQESVEKVSADIYLSSGNHLTAYEKVRLINYVIFDLNHFTRNNSNFYSPQNSYINQVIETRKGNPISLGIIYLEIAKILKLPIYAVALPKCFVLAYMNEYRHAASNDLADDVLFYINPYNKGATLNRLEIEQFITQQKLERKPEYLLPCNNDIIIKRLIVNLMTAYEKMGFEEKNEPLKKLLDVFQLQKRDV